MRKPSISAPDCSGCGLCESIAPDVFQLGADGVATVADLDAYDEGACREAAESCPSEAIIL